MVAEAIFTVIKCQKMSNNNSFISAENKNLFNQYIIN